ncbi:MAG: hypothetical protein HRT82_04910 [Henriciella sp.]|nr:hypothetical protein [Henriciella sp.]
MKRLILALLILPISAISSAADEAATVSTDDLSVITGDDWTGELTYLNYGEPVIDFTIAAEIDVTEIEGGFEFSFQYPDEPHANMTAVTTISADGAMINDETVIANTLLDNGTREIRTQFGCEDLGRPATCEMIYTLSETQFELRKMVTYEGEAEAFRRNSYAFTR